MRKILVTSLLILPYFFSDAQSNKVLLKSGEILLTNELQEINLSGLTYCYLVFDNIPIVKKYKYLGIEINERVDCQDINEKKMQAI